MKKFKISTVAAIAVYAMLAESSLFVFLDYEIRSSWWASLIGWNWGQKLSGKYFAWKVKRKYGRYKQSKMWEQRIKNFR